MPVFIVWVKTAYILNKQKSNALPLVPPCCLQDDLVHPLAVLPNVPSSDFLPDTTNSSQASTSMHRKITHSFPCKISLTLEGEYAATMQRYLLFVCS